MRLNLYVTVLLLASAATQAQVPDTVFLEELTWTEVQALIDDGTTTVIVPTAGLEQTGPHIVLGKHKYRMNAGAERIARALGNALVAPVLMYVPEGNIDPPSGHMRFAGTITVPPDVFKSVLEYATRSLRVHGFTDILLIGDSGGNQDGMREVAEMLNDEWADGNTRVHFVSEWYYTSNFRDWLAAKGEPRETMAGHGGLIDTATLLAVAPERVRTDKMSVGLGGDVDGVSGDPTGATPEIGRTGFDFLFEAAMAQIRDMLADR